MLTFFANNNLFPVNEPVAVEWPSDVRKLKEWHVRQDARIALALFHFLNPGSFSKPSIFNSLGSQT
jgi:hypothetical protein